VPVAEHVRRNAVYPAAMFSASSGGLLVYSPNATDTSTGGSNPDFSPYYGKKPLFMA